MQRSTTYGVFPVMQLNMMKRRAIAFTLLLLASLATGMLQAQQAPAPYRSYFFEGDDIVFEFDVRLYEEATHDRTNRQLDFEDLDIHDVAVSGEFNNWSLDGWKMNQVGPYRYQLRKRITDFNDAPTWQFKFLVNGMYWAEPPPDAPNRVVTIDNWFFKDIYNLELNTMGPVAEGNAKFFLKGHLQAKSVILTGTFVHWDEHRIRMEKQADGWTIELNLPPDHYEYKFLVDGEWMHDPGNPRKVRNEHGTWNSVLDIRVPVRFRLSGYPSAKQVFVAGTFNDWDPRATRMSWINGGWSVQVPVPGGKVLYKFIVDGQWITDPANPIREHDGHGHINSVMMAE